MIVPRRGADELAGVFSKELDDGLRVFFLERLAGNNHRTGIHVFGRKARILISLMDEIVDFVSIDLSRRYIWGQHDGRTIKHFSGGDFELAGKRRAFAPQGDMRKNQMRS